MKKTIRELYHEVLKKAEEYGVEFTTFKRERFEDEFDDTIDSLLGTIDWSFNTEINLEDYENILGGYEEEFEAEKEKKNGWWNY